MTVFRNEIYTIAFAYLHYAPYDPMTRWTN
jgi:hypothetical protein